MKCPQCGTKNPRGSRFCTRCGAGLTGPVSASAPRRRGPTGRGCLGCLGLIVLLLIVGYMYGSRGSSGQQTAAPAATTPTILAAAPVQETPAHHAVVAAAHQPPDEPPTPLAPTTTPLPTDTPIPSATPLPTETPQPSDTPLPTSTTDPLTQGCDPDNGACVVASRFTMSAGGEYDQPSAGMVYGLVRVTITNAGEQTIHYNSLDFALKGVDDRVVYHSTLVGSDISNTLLSYGDLAPGDTVAGDVAFALPTTRQSYDMTWHPNLFGPYVPVKWQQ